MLIAKRYVKALIGGKDVAAIAKMNDQLKLVSSAYGDEKFLSIISSIYVTSDKKVELILSFVEDCEESVKNLINLLGQNRRLDIIPEISTEVTNQLSVLSNNYNGVVYSNEALSSEYMTSITERFSQKFNVTLSLENEVCDYDGIKVDIDGLGVEIGFSNERLKSQMIEHILKAV
jgi:F-type H+-transporting ATPase subunit delta